MSRRSRAVRAAGDLLLAGSALALGAAARPWPARWLRRAFGLLGRAVGPLLPERMTPRGRARASGVALDSGRWAAAMARTAAGLLRPPPLEVAGWEPAERAAPGGVLVLSAHFESWEAAAAELVRRGRPTTVVAAPWPGLPRTERVVRRLRRRNGVRAVPRSAAGWREATVRLRAGEAVVLLVDSASAARRGRRASPFPGGSIAAPDAAVRWALSNGAALWLATGGGERWSLHTLRGAAAGSPRPEAVEVRRLADRVAAELGGAVAREPTSWAWVRALAGLAFAATGVACAVPEVPPMPLEAEAWTAEAEAVGWTGAVQEGVEGRLHARRAEVRWRDGGPTGRFEDLELTLLPTGGEPPGRVLAARAEGRWPAGPITLYDVAWELGDAWGSGRVDRLTRTGEGRWDCGGCAFESWPAALAGRP